MAPQDSGWITSWYWRWRALPDRPPSTPQSVPPDRAEELGQLVAFALERKAGDGPLPILALVEDRLSSVRGLAERARVEYRVALRVRFPNNEVARGVVRRAVDHAHVLEEAGRLLPTRAPFYLGEVLTLGGVSVLTARADLLLGDGPKRIGVFVPVACSRGAAAGGPMQFLLQDATTGAVHACADDVLARAWHAPLAGGEMVALMPPFAPPRRARSSASRRAISRSTIPVDRRDTEPTESARPSADRWER